MVLPIQQIEFHVTHVCNLQCDGCTHYCNFGTRGMVPFPEGKEWLLAWSQRVIPERFKLLGGEPTLHPELVDYVRLVSHLWPKARRTVTSNGAFLDRQPALADVLAETQTRLYITVHSDQPKYLSKIIPIIRQWSRLSRQKGFILEVGDARYVWYKQYKGMGEDIAPYDDRDPRSSWDVCISKYCSQLHKNRLWKCPCLAYLDLIADRLKLRARNEWKPYLSYGGIGLDASMEELRDFLQIEGEPCCGMCPRQLVRLDRSAGGCENEIDLPM